MLLDWEFIPYNTDNFNVNEQMQTFVNNGGEILAWGICLKIRNKEGSEMYPLSTMKNFLM